MLVLWRVDWSRTLLPCLVKTPNTQISVFLVFTPSYVILPTESIVHIAKWLSTIVYDMFFKYEIWRVSKIQYSMKFFQFFNPLSWKKGISYTRYFVLARQISPVLWNDYPWWSCILKSNQNELFTLTNIFYPSESYGWFL